MTLSQQVVSLELAKRLKELGVKQESLFYWEMPIGEHKSMKKREAFLAWNDDVADTSSLKYGAEHPWNNSLWDSCSAFTVAELGEMLPAYVKGARVEYSRHGNWWKQKDESLEWWGVEYHDITRFQGAKTEADARAKMLIHLLENNLIDLAKVEGKEGV